MEQQICQLMVARLMRYNMFFCDVVIEVPLKLTPCCNQIIKNAGNSDVKNTQP